MIVLFHKMLDSEDKVQRNKALLALTRVRPLPPRAKELLLTPPSESARLRGLLETMTFAFRRLRHSIHFYQILRK